MREQFHLKNVACFSKNNVLTATNVLTYYATQVLSQVDTTDTKEAAETTSACQTSQSMENTPTTLKALEPYMELSMNLVGSILLTEMCKIMMHLVLCAM